MNIENTIRREQFCQIKDEIRGSDAYLIVGIDVAKDKHHAFMGTATGKSLLRKLIFENNLEGFRMLLEGSEAIKDQNALSKVVFGLEPTGNYHKPLGAYLIRSGLNVVRSPAKRLKTTVSFSMAAGTKTTIRMRPMSPIWSPGPNVFIMTIRQVVSTSCGSHYRFEGV
jgi:hypothetical protein